MSQSSPEGIILGKGSTLESFSLSINKEKVLELKQQERMYSEEELQQKIDAHLEVAKDLWLSAIKEQERMYSEEEVVNILIKAYEDIGKRKIPNQVVLASWFEQFKKK